MIDLHKLGRYVGRTALRRVVWIIVGIAVYAAIGWVSPAHAATYSTQSAAYGGCMSAGAAAVATRNGTNPGRGYESRCMLSGNPPGIQKKYECQIRQTTPPGSFGGCHNAGQDQFHSWTDVTSCPGGAVVLSNGSCSATPEQCTALNTGGGFGVQTTKPFSTRYLANGCQLAMTPGTGTCTVVAGSPTELCNGEFTFTGQVGEVVPPDVYIPGPDTPQEAADNRPQECTSVGGASHSYCVKSSGQHCVTSAANRQLCWQPGETGTKTDGPVAQVRNAGTNANAPDLNLPNGDTLQASGTGITSTTSNNITTTTKNYTTVHGTNAGSKNQGEAGDGSGSGKESDGDEKTTASGGEDCERKPIVSDPALEMVANQAWATRCAVEAGNAAKVTGDIGVCNAPFNVEGENANAEQLRAMRVQICGDQAIDWDFATEAAATVDGVAGEGDPADAFSDGSENPGAGDGELDTSGYGYGNSCPVLPSINVMGTTVDFNVHGAKMCDWFRLAGQIVLLLAALSSLRIIAAGGA